MFFTNTRVILKISKKIGRCAHTVPQNLLSQVVSHESCWGFHPMPKHTMNLCKQMDRITFVFLIYIILFISYKNNLLFTVFDRIYGFLFDFITLIWIFHPIMFP